MVLAAAGGAAANATLPDCTDAAGIVGFGMNCVGLAQFCLMASPELQFMTAPGNGCVNLEPIVTNCAYSCFDSDISGCAFSKTSCKKTLPPASPPSPPMNPSPPYLPPITPLVAVNVGVGQDWPNGTQMIGGCRKMVKPPSTACAPGEKPDGDTCKLCDPGYFSAEGKQCVVCKDGSYAPEQGATSCIKCETAFGPGYSTSKTDSGLPKALPTQCVACGPGTYGRFQVPCTPCDTGSWSTGAENMNCAHCPTGTYLDAEAAGCPGNDVTKCLLNVAPPDGSCKYCPAGQGPRTIEGGIAIAGEEGVSCGNCTGNTWHVGGMETGCVSCPAGEEIMQFLPQSVLDGDFAACKGPYETCGVDFSEQCVDDCSVKGASFVVNKNYGSCTALPPQLQVVAVEGVETIFAKCSAGTIHYNPSTPIPGLVPPALLDECVPCEAGTFALAGAVKCTPCAVGYSSEKGSGGCMPDGSTALPTCAAEERSYSIQNYDCVLNYLNTGNPKNQAVPGLPHLGFGCDNLFNVLAGHPDNIIEGYVGGLKRFCPLSVKKVADYLQASGRKGVAYKVRMALAQAEREWGLDDDESIRFPMVYAPGMFSTLFGMLAPLAIGCIDYDAFVAAGEGPGWVIGEKYNADLFPQGKQCTPSGCDDRFEETHCAYAPFAVACPQKCGGVVPSSKIMCEEPTLAVNAGVQTVNLPPVLSRGTPIQGPEMAACGPGWGMNQDTGLIEPKCGKPPSLKYCPDAAFSSDNMEPKCAVGKQPSGTECDPDDETSCDAGLTCMCPHSRARARSLLFASKYEPEPKPTKPEPEPEKPTEPEPEPCTPVCMKM